jgi:hypothetical protein
MNITKDHLPWSTKNYKLNYLWVCPECGEINAWNADEARRAAEKIKCTKIYLSHGSCFDNICGHCGRDIVHPDSPILAECYTHQSQE